MSKAALGTFENPDQNLLDYYAIMYDLCTMEGGKGAWLDLIQKSSPALHSAILEGKEPWKGVPTCAKIGGITWKFRNVILSIVGK